MTDKSEEKVASRWERSLEHAWKFPVLGTLFDEPQISILDGTGLAFTASRNKYLLRCFKLSKWNFGTCMPVNSPFDSDGFAWQYVPTPGHLLLYFLLICILITDLMDLDISSDCLSLILASLDLDEIFALWLTGASSVRQNLSRIGAWRNFIITEHSHMGCIDTWPHHLLGQLSGLRSLSLSPNSPSRLLPRLKVHYDDLKLLSRGLTFLQLAYIDAICDDDVDALPPTLTRLVLPYNKRISPKGLTNLPSSLTSLDLRTNTLITDVRALPRNVIEFRGCPWALKPSSFTAETPTSLITLVLLATDHAEELLWQWTDISLLAASSPSLIRLELNLYSFGERPYESAIDFPNSLEVLKLHALRFPPEALPKLPLGLKKLKLRTKMDLSWVNSDLQFLPPGLLHLDHRPEASLPPGSDKALTIACFRTLPSGLISLRLRGVDLNDERGLQAVDFYRELPSSLRKLRVPIITADAYWPEMPQVPAHELPLGLTRYWGAFTASLIDQTAPPTFKFDQLQARRTMHRGNGPTVIITEDHGLPYYHKLGWLHDSIRVMALDLASPNDLLLLPSRLLSLTLNISRSVQSKHDEMMLYLPDTLTMLEIDSGAALSDECLPALPHGLRTFRVRWTSEILRGDIYPFPNKLTTLCLGSADCVNYAPNFPHFLTELELFCPSVSDETLSALPKYLTRLEVRNVAAAYLNASIIFPLLPRSLLHLIMRPTMAYLEDEDIAALPRGLISFTSYGSGGSLTDASAALWPPRLQTLSFTGDSYSFIGLKALPKTLTELDMPNATLALPPPPGESTAYHFGSHLRRAAIGHHVLPPHVQTP